MSKRVVITLLALLLSFIHILAQEPAIDLAGKWEDKMLNITYEFNADSSVHFSQSGYPVFINAYTLDLTKDPGWIDFTMSNGPRTIVIKGLIKVIDTDHIWIEQFGPFSEHPMEFSEEDGNIQKIHRLKRVKE